MPVIERWFGEVDRFGQNVRVTMGFYYNWGEEFDAYPVMMQEATTVWVQELSSFIKGE